MGRYAYWSAIGVFLAAAALGAFSSALNAARDGSSAGDLYKPILPEGVFTQIVTEEAKALKDAAAKASDKKQAMKARSLAMMIAIYAQGEVARGGPKAAAMAGLRDAALNVAKAVGDGKIDEAKKLVSALAPSGKADAGAKVGPMPIHDDFDVDTLMQVFRRERSGGMDWELKLNKLVEKRGAFSATEYQQMVPLMYRIAAVAQATEAYAPTMPMGKKLPADWIKLSKDMGVEALAVAELAKKPKPDDKMVKATLKKLENSCTVCHEKFRDAK